MRTIILNRPKEGDRATESGVLERRGRYICNVKVDGHGRMKAATIFHLLVQWKKVISIKYDGSSSIIRLHHKSIHTITSISTSPQHHATFAISSETSSATPSLPPFKPQRRGIAVGLTLHFQNQALIQARYISSWSPFTPLLFFFSSPTPHLLRPRPQPRQQPPPSRQ